MRHGYIHIRCTSRLRNTFIFLHSVDRPMPNGSRSQRSANIPEPPSLGSRDAIVAECDIWRSADELYFVGFLLPHPCGRQVRDVRSGRAEKQRRLARQSGRRFSIENTSAGLVSGPNAEQEFFRKCNRIDSSTGSEPAPRRD